MATLDWPITRFAHAIFSAVAAIAWAFTDILVAIGHQAWAFVDIEPQVAAALERLARTFAQLQDRSTAFAAFVQRALTHANYTAGHFDPGRMPA